MNKRLLSVGIVLAFLVCAVLVIAFCGGIGTARFTSERWQAVSWNERQGMVPSLLRQVEFVGMSREEITDLLGPETPDDPAAGPYPSAWRTPYNLVYDFGAKRHAMGENLALLFFFREDGYCEGYYLLTYSW